MQTKKITTSKLLQNLFKTSSLDRFFRRLDDTDSNIPSFHDYINNVCADKGVPQEHIIKRADIDRTYGHQLFRGTRTPSRDKVIQLAFGFEMGYEEAQKLLAVARKSALHPKVKRDAVIIYAFERNLTLGDVQATLFDLGVKLLGKDRNYG
ncbi:MAG: hypothetical protein LBD23_20735 [Oscillospiraceae bacterium]|nr:hypothetical protein [Oscillospiraceae bacterium]